MEKEIERKTVEAGNASKPYLSIHPCPSKAEDSIEIKCSCQQLLLKAMCQIHDPTGSKLFQSPWFEF